MTKGPAESSVALAWLSLPIEPHADDATLLALFTLASLPIEPHADDATLLALFTLACEASDALLFNPRNPYLKSGAC